MSPPVEAFEYDHLTEVYRKEQRTKNITEVRKDLYVVIRQRLVELRRDMEREFALDQFSTRAKLAANQLTKFQEKADQVFEFRMEKLLAMALRAALGNRVDTNRLTAEEVDIFERVSSLLRERHAVLLDAKAGGGEVRESLAVEPFIAQAPEAPPVPADDMPEMAPDFADDMEEMDDQDGMEDEDVDDVPEDLPAPPAPPTPEPAAAPAAEAMNGVVVLRMMEDLPPFAGPGKDYRLSKEDVVCLPSTIAKALVAGKKARLVQIPGL